ncbi:MAG TPA: hypothetical protein VF067_03405 [Sphingomicrobium sp.]
MIMATVVAVALGLAPVRDDAAQTISGDYSAVVGQFSQSVDNRGITHVTGFNRFNGAPYQISIDRDGYVKAIVGDSYITFRVQEPG